MEKNISSRQIRQRGKSTIDPRFAVPLGLIDLENEQKNDIVSDPGSGDNSTTGGAAQPLTLSGLQVVDIGGNATPSQTQTIAYIPPTNVTVFSQLVKILPDGSHLVDVTLDVQDNSGVVEYDVRATKL